MRTSDITYDFDAKIYVANHDLYILVFNKNRRLCILLTFPYLCYQS